MNYALSIAGLVLLMTSCGEQKKDVVNTKEETKAPEARIIAKELTNHGHTRIDNYYWMNERDSPEVLEY